MIQYRRAGRQGSCPPVSGWRQPVCAVPPDVEIDVQFLESGDQGQARRLSFKAIRDD